MGDYFETIPCLGITDFFSTWLGEMWHQRVKHLFSQSNKKNTAEGISKHKHQAQEHLEEHDQSVVLGNTHSHHVCFNQPDPLPYAGLDVHHHISDSTDYHQDLFKFIQNLGSDPAAKDFIPNLKNHLLTHLHGKTINGVQQKFSNDNRQLLHILNNCIYSHKVLHVNYTTYDVWCDQDSLNLRTYYRNVMVNSGKIGAEPHEFWYTHILRVFHIHMQQTGHLATTLLPQDMYFTWVHWFSDVPYYKCGSRLVRLPKILFLLESESVVRHPDEYDDWLYYYVNIFADRDLFMWFFRDDDNDENSNVDIGNRETSNDDGMDVKENADSEAEEDDQAVYGKEEDDNVYDLGAEDGEDIDFSFTPVHSSLIS
ncbi:hypothetical protein C8Q75DRAFT_807432 [Abortiporus biennis]|nr:hypothetical protein C8Q75DRAFT_807432 [Abortiporus biennis]